jgi:hypothetical protein
MVVATMSGRGSASANGGGMEVNGGGGRIAIQSVDIATLDITRLEALGGAGGGAKAGNGTIYLGGVATGGGTLVVDGQGAGSSYSALPIPPGHVFERVIIRNQARVVMDDALVVRGMVEILGGSILTHTSGWEAGLRIRAGRVEIDATSAIDVTGKGYLGGERPGNDGINEGRTLANQIGAPIHTGGSHGGPGGTASAAPAGLVYGAVREPVDLGSGGGRGGSDSYPGGSGGGRVTIEAAEALVVQGAIRADGQVGAGASAGSGSGGSIRIETALLRGGGAISANGGAGEVGGGGGRVCIDYSCLGLAGDDFGGTRTITAFGGNSGAASGGAGTVVLRRPEQAYGDLYVDDNRVGRTTTIWTPLPHIGFGRVQAVGVDMLTADGTVAYLPGALVGLEVNPNLNQTRGYTIVSNDATTLVVDLGGQPVLTNVTSVGASYAAVHRFDNMYFRRGGFMASGDKVVVTDAVRIDDWGRWTHFDATTGFVSRLELEAATVTLTTNGFIDVDERGYLGGARPGNSGSNSGRTEGNVTGSGIHAGGSFGGIGGRASAAYAPNASYGSLTQPAALGSGGGRGGSDSYPGGDGGGVVRIVADAMVLDGTITAQGRAGFGSSAGGGSGGSIALEAEMLSGSGYVRANGGGGEVGGGGGRVALRYGALALPQSHIEVCGGQAGAATGGNGTLHLRQSSQVEGDLVVDGQGATTPDDLCPIPGGYRFDNVVLRNRARVSADAGLAASGRLSLLAESVLTHSRHNVEGLRIAAAALDIDATSAIDVTARGYRGGERDGRVGNNGETLGGAGGAPLYAGGSYGGLGAQSGSALGFGVYAAPGEAVYLGSGGGRGGSDSYPGGNGGGRVDLTVSGALRVDGIIQANGQVGAGASAGSGSGGSIRIAAGTLLGAGTIAADGGAGEVGGGGGRVVVEYGMLGGANADLGDLRNVHAFGGHGATAWGGAGTVLLRQAAQRFGDLYVDDNLAGQAAPIWTPLTHIGFGTITDLTATELTTDGKVPFMPGGLVGLTVNPNILQERVFTVAGNTETSLVVSVTGGISLLDVAAVGDTYAAVHRFDNVTFRRGGFLATGDRLVVEDTLRLDEYGALTHFDATVTAEPRLDITAAHVAIATGSAITVNGRGYLGGERPGNEGTNEGRTEGNAQGSAIHAGGSHGGLGAGSGANPLYGSAAQPVALGSGGGRGGSDSYPGGDGGGRVHLRAGTLVLDGMILASGGAGAGARAGGGSGGSVLVEAGALSGAGAVRADGGGSETGGGGGRVAIYCSAAQSQTNALVFAAAGGVGGGGGAVGTVVLDGNYVWTAEAPAALARSLGIAGLALSPDGRLVLTLQPEAAAMAAGANADGGLMATRVVEFTETLRDPDWVVVTNVVAGDGQVEVTCPEAGRGFLRVRRVP